MSAENSESEIVQASGAAHGGGGSLVVNATLRSTLTIQHLTSADFFATQATDIEDKARADGVMFGDSTYDEIAPRHSAYVIGAVFAAVAFVEAAVNDIFSLAIDPMYKTDDDYKGTLVEVLTSEARQRFADAWEEKDPETGHPTGKGLVREANALEKFKQALKLAGFPLSRAESGGGLYNNVDCLIDFRNYLTHSLPSKTTYYSEEDRLSDDDRSNKIVKRLHDNGVRESALGMRERAIVAAQTRYLSADCAKWAVRSSAGGVLFFHSKLGITAYNDRLKSLLKNKELAEKR
jgi:hypothetical protein